MPIIVERRDTRQRYILVGTGFGAYHATKPNWFFGNLMADEQSGEMSVVAVCDEAGAIGWCNSRELTVVSVDGVSPESVLMGS